MTGFIDKIMRLSRKFKIVPKLVCLFLSVILWAVIANRQSGRVLMRVPIEYKNLSDRLVISEYSDKYVSISLEGKKEHLKGLTEKNLKAYVDLSNPILGVSKNYSINFIRQQVPDNVTMNPSSREVTLTVERIRNKWVKVIPRIIGTPPAGKTVGKLKVQPEYVMISGAMPFLKEIDFVYTDDISIVDQGDDATRNIEINQNKYPDVIFSDTTVRVTIPFIKSENLYDLELPITVYNVDGRFSVEPVDAKVRVYLKSYDVAKYDVESIEAYIDAAGINFQQLIRDNVSSFEKAMPVLVRLKQGKNAVPELISVLPENAVIVIIKK